MPNIKEYEVKFLFSTGNYNNETLSYRLTLVEGETLEQVVDELRVTSALIIGPDASEMCNLRTQLKREIAQLKSEVEKNRAEYEALSKFLAAQGIKEMTAIPQFSNLLLKAQEELVVEIVDDSEDEDDDIPV